MALLAAIPIVPTIPGAPVPGTFAHSFSEGAGPSDPSRGRPSGPFPLSVSITLPGARVEPNAPFTLRAVTEGVVDGTYQYLWNDSLGTIGTNQSITLVAPSGGSVSASVAVRDGLGDSAEASAAIGVGSAPSIALASAIGATDVGLPIPLTIQVNGSFPPYRVTWTPLPEGSVDQAILQGPGELEVATSDELPGYAWIQASVTDRYSVTATIDAIVATVHPRPELLLTATPSDVDAGAPALVTGLVVGGTPPYAWSAAASLPVTNVTGSSGAVGSSEPVEWSGVFDGPGNGTVRIDLADAAGVLLTANVSVRVFPSLTPTLAIETVAPSAGSPLNLSLDLVGGVAPYTYTMTLSDGEESEGRAPVAGPVLWVAHPAVPGFLAVRIALEDSVSGTATVVSTVLLAPSQGASGTPDPAMPGAPGPNPAPKSAASAPNDTVSYLVLGALLLLVGGAVLYAWRRRRSATPNSPPTDGAAVEVIGRLLKDSDGTESSALRVLAEEEGLTKGEVDAALRSLEVRGQVHVEPGPDGSQLVHWIDAKSVSSTSGKAP